MNAWTLTPPTEDGYYWAGRKLTHEGRSITNVFVVEVMRGRVYVIDGEGPLVSGEGRDWFYGPRIEPPKIVVVPEVVP